MKEEFKAYISIHLAVILFGFTAILGAVITLPAMILVWWRVMIAGIGLTFFLRDFHFLRTISRLQLLRFIGIGSIISIHWVLFFLSVKLAGASVCLVCMATTCLFVSFIEPILLRKTFRKLDIGIALLIVPGMAMVVQSLEVSRYPGVLAGLSSAFLAAIFSTLNKKYIRIIMDRNVECISDPQFDPYHQYTIGRSLGVVASKYRLGVPIDTGICVYHSRACYVLICTQIHICICAQPGDQS